MTFLVMFHSCSVLWPPRILGFLKVGQATGPFQEQAGTAEQVLHSGSETNSKLMSSFKWCF
ncbi:hypothetical protein OUZ56_008865 [Daphnia magna]|uniref:Uncharacterized protein n=1 Tax=Daphnia magna TaxID=35525 RepID=A0ABR0AEL9_9CRUS|nr:hypothetical protein OUZ56_008865 [Daphnia magna]